MRFLYYIKFKRKEIQLYVLALKEEHRSAIGMTFDFLAWQNCDWSPKYMYLLSGVYLVKR